jgi:hypothetical protein
LVGNALVGAVGLHRLESLFPFLHFGVGQVFRAGEIDLALAHDLAEVERLEVAADLAHAVDDHQPRCEPGVDPPLLHLARVHPLLGMGPDALEAALLEQRFGARVAEHADRAILDLVEARDVDAGAADDNQIVGEMLCQPAVLDPPARDCGSGPGCRCSAASERCAALRPRA